MNFHQKRNVLFRLASGFLLLLNLGVSAFAMSQVIMLRPDDPALLIIAIGVTSVFSILEMFIILKGWKKDSYLYKIAFNDNGRVNNVPLIAVIVGTALGLGLSALGISVYILRSDVTIKCSMLIVASISSYLLVNCMSYYFYLILFRNREVNLKDLIK